MLTMTHFMRSHDILLHASGRHVVTGGAHDGMIAVWKIVTPPGKDRGVDVPSSVLPVLASSLERFQGGNYSPQGRADDGSVTSSSSEVRRGKENELPR